nr:DUF262 domain-containing protein [uncultured Porphyromonas sp.]
MIDNHSLREFLDKYTAVEIPILQRDYAQGRLDPRTKEMNRKGENFLSVLFNALREEKELRMDIIYGSIETRDGDHPEEKTFIPLDGQQRLTTLWLLHWYLSQWEERSEEIASLLQRFTYATRSTARDFCQRLCSLRLTRDELANPSEYFSNKMWFTSKYSYDPTIQAMLNMLNAIAKEQHKQPVSFDMLESLQFRSFDIGAYELTDELYIKMNRRGKQLESIENLKADFVGYLKKIGHDFSKPDSYDRKLDHEWADMAWGGRENEDFDIRYLRLFNRYFYNLWIMDNPPQEGEESSTPEYLNLHFTGTDYRGFEAYEAILSKDGRLERMVRFFDFLASDRGIIYSDYLRNPWRDKNKEQDSAYPYLLDVVKLSMLDRIALYALMLYVDNASDEVLQSLEHYQAWMRIVWNLIADPKLRSYQAQRRYMLLLAQLAPHSTTIERFLISTDIEKIGISSTGDEKARLKLEQDKLRYIGRYPNRREALLRAECIPCLQGQVGFLLGIEGDDDHFSKIVELTEKNVRADWDWGAEYLWPALISLLEEPLFDLSYEGKFDYLSHKEHGSGIHWRLQNLLNRPHITKALLSLFERCLQDEDREFTEVCEELHQSYEYDERIPWHYPLVKSKRKILLYAEQGRIYNRWGEGICLQKSWRVTENEWCGYWCLTEKEPVMRTK